MNECSRARPRGGRILLGLVVLAALIAIASQAPEIARYLKSASM